MGRWIRRGALALLGLLMIGVLTAWWLMRGSLPQLEGQSRLPGLASAVTVQRDALGVATIDAANERDAMRALGYLHAQERYFEMDLLRRTAAGELSGLFGPIAVETDKRHRVHRLRARIRANLASITGSQQAQLQAYTDGVNAGVAALRTRPWAYLLLRQQPQQWRIEDSALVGYAMYFDLQDASNARELAMWKLESAMPPALHALLARDGTRWDAPLQGAPRGDALLPDAATLDLRTLPMPADAQSLEVGHDGDIGSNNFAVAGALTRDGRAILADDMHLGLRAPNLWFRARLRYADARAPGGKVDVAGFTLPGLPAVVVGSNGHVAWGFTNGYIDAADWSRIPACTTPTAKALPTCITPPRVFRESIEVAGAAPVAFDITEFADYGPVISTAANGERLALRWTAQADRSLNLDLTGLAHAGDLDEALALARDVRMPTQNLLLADRSGRIAWRLLGGVPQHIAQCDPQLSLSNGRCTRWQLTSELPAMIVDPPQHRLWTANNRTLDGAALAQVGDGGYALGARARQIRDGLFARQQFAERDLLAIQLDDRALFLHPWWRLLQERSATTADQSAMRELASAARTWQGRASTDSVSFRIARAWRLAVHERLLDGMMAPARAKLGTDFELPTLNQFEGVAWPLVQQRPAHLLPRRYWKCASTDAAGQAACNAQGWSALFEDAAAQVRDALREDGPLAQRTWGEQNTAAICHPLSRALPGVAKPLLCMPADPLPGDGAMPRVQRSDFGASQRMVVSPGHEADGIAHMPGGQSGHPMSPFWGAGHDDWVQGRPTPFLPGATRYTLRMVPR